VASNRVYVNMRREKLDLLVQYYRKYLFSLPNWKILLVIRPIPLLLLIYILHSYTPIFLFLYDILHGIIDKVMKLNVFNRRRLLGLGTIASFYSLLAVLLKYAFSTRIDIQTVFVPYVIPFIIISMGLYNIFLSFLYISLAFILSILSSCTSNTTICIDAAIVKYFTLALTTVIAYCLLKSNSQIFELGKGFFNYWLTGNSEIFERELIKLSRIERVTIYNIIFITNENKVKCIITIPYAHPGPFRDIGSSSLPHLLIDNISKTFSCPVIVLHGACDHTLDLVSRNETENLVRDLTDYLLLESGTDASLSHFNVLSSNGITLYYTSITGGFNKTLIFVEDNNGSIDDIPYLLQQDFLDRALLIDCHSSFIENRLSSNVDFTLRKAIDRVLEKMPRPANKLRVGSSLLRSPQISRLTKGEICEGGISTLVLDYCCEKILVIVYDSNNVVLSVRKRIQEYFHKKYGFNKVIVCSTDTHRYTGHIKGRGYRPLGEKTDLNTIIGLTRTAVEDALNNTTYSRIKTSIFSRKCRVLGKKVYEISAYAQRAVKITLFLMFSLFFLALI